MKKSIFLLLLLGGVAYGQKTTCEADCSCSISGTIVDAKSDEPIPFVSIQIKETSKGAVTDEQGHFVISNICQSEFDILITHLGYKSVTHHHDAYHLNPVIRLAPSEVILESIVVEDHRSVSGFNSENETAISAKDLSDVKAESLGDILTSITGVSTIKTGQNVVKPIIHGLHSNRILIINNGIRHESQDWGESHAPEIDPSLANNINLIKGAAAVKYGPNALGGVIVINPPKLELSSHLHGEIGLTGESNGRAVDGNMLFQKGHKNFAWILQGAGRYQGDLKAPDYQLTNTGMREWSFATGMKYHWRRTDITAYYSRVEQQLGILRGSVTGNLEDLADAIADRQPDFTGPFSYTINTPNQQVSHDLLKLEGIHNWPNSQLKMQYGFQVNKRQEFDVRRGTNNERPSIDLELYTHTVDAEWVHPEFNGWEGSIGTQVLYQDNNNLPGTNTIPFVPNYNNSRVGVYFAESRPVGSITFEVGLRYDYQFAAVRGRDIDNTIYSNDQTYQSVSGIVGVSKLLSKNSSFNMNLATAWRPPNIAELFSFGKHRATIDYGFYRYAFENGEIRTDRILSEQEANVKNELGIKWIADFTYNKNGLRLEASPYLNYLKNYIYKRPQGITSTVRGPFPYFVYLQTDALFAGLDATAVYNHSQRWESKLSGSYLWVKDIKNDDVIFGVPANRLSYKLLFTNKVGKNYEWRSSIEANYIFRQNRAPRVISPENFISNNDFNPFSADDSTFDFVPAPDSYLLLNTSSDININQWIVGVKVKNVLNRTYRDYTNLLRYFADEPGINFQLSLKRQF